MTWVFGEDSVTKSHNLSICETSVIDTLARVVVWCVGILKSCELTHRLNNSDCWGVLIVLIISSVFYEILSLVVKLLLYCDWYAYMLLLLYACFKRRHLLLVL